MKNRETEKRLRVAEPSLGGEAAEDRVVLEAFSADVITKSLSLVKTECTANLKKAPSRQN